MIARREKSRHRVARPAAPGRVVTLSTELADPSPIYFGHGIDDHFVEHIARHDFDRLIFCAEEPVFRLHGRRLFDDAQRHFPCWLHYLPPGEKSKSFATLEDLCEALVAAGVSKRSIIVALGGGVVGNLVGLASALIYRGVRYVEVPTTLTAQTDSTLSNKQAINGRRGKNHFGVYYRPLFVWTDTAYLRTEPVASRRGGLVEAVKNGFIDDAAFLDELEEILHPELTFDDEQLHALALRIIESKCRILRRDPSEKREGVILEYGHTFGHALEWLSAGTLSHGEAVGVGMKLAARLAHGLGLIPEALVARHDRLLDDKLGLSVRWPAAATVDALLDVMTHDNKKTSRALRFVLLADAGKCCNPEGDYLVTVDETRVRRIVEVYSRG